MSIQTRRERERAERERRIVDVASEIAEAQGWAAVTMRRLSDEIEYSQPVIYGHFADGRIGIVRAVALRGFEALAEMLQRARAATGSSPDALRAVVQAYLDFSSANPATYEAMFSMPIGIPFADESTPAPLTRGFASLHDALTEATGPDESGVRTELLWSTLHGMSVLTRDGRVRPGNESERIAALLDASRLKA